MKTHIPRQKHHRSARLLKYITHCTLSILIALSLNGCGGPKYSKDMKIFLGDYFASNFPLKFEGTKIEQLSEGSSASVALFHADLTVTENLYTSAISNKPISDVVAQDERMIMAGVPNTEIQTLQQELKSIPDVPILKVVIPAGQKITSSGKLRATLRDDGSWGFTWIDQPSGLSLGTKAPSGQWYQEGSPEARAYLTDVNAKIAHYMATSDKAIQSIKDARQAEAAHAALVQAQIAAENKKRVDAFLSDCAGDKVMYGSWQTAEANGEIGINFGKSWKTAQGYSFEGYLFDPADHSHTKPFNGRVTGTGSVDSPFKFDLSVTKGGGVITGYCGYGHIPTQFINKTGCFLLDAVAYHCLLTYSPEAGSLQGNLTAQDTLPMFLPKSLFGDQTVSMQFAKSYVPKSTETSSENSSTISQVTNGKSAATPLELVQQAQSQRTVAPSQGLNSERPAPIRVPHPNRNIHIYYPSDKFPKDIVGQGLAGSFLIDGEGLSGGEELIPESAKLIAPLCRHFVVLNHSTGLPPGAIINYIDSLKIIEIPRSNPLIFVRNNGLGNYDVKEEKY